MVVGPGGRLKSWPLAGNAPLSPAMPRTVELIGGGAMSYAQLYRTQPYVFACVNILGRLVGMLPVKTYQGDDDDRKRLRDHPAALLIERPYPGGTRSRLMRAITSDIATHGASLTVKFRPRPSAPPTELWPISWRYITPLPGKERPIDGYRYHGPAGERIFLPEDVIHIQWWSPDGGAGVSPLEPLRETLATEVAGRLYARSSFENGARPSGVVTHPRPLKKEQREALREELQGLYAGVDPKFRIALLDGGLEWRQMSYSAQEAEAIGYRKLSREEVATVYNVPQPAIGVLDHATFSNVTEQHRMLYQDTLGPWLDLIESDLSAQLIDAEPGWRGSGIFHEFDLDGVLRGNPRERSESQQRAFQSGQATPNDLRRMENQAKIEDPLADCVFVPANMVPLGPGADAWRERVAGGGVTLRDVSLAAQQFANAVEKGIIEKAEARAMLAAAMGASAEVGSPIAAGDGEG